MDWSKTHQLCTLIWHNYLKPLSVTLNWFQVYVKLSLFFVAFLFCDLTGATLFWLMSYRLFKGLAYSHAHLCTDVLPSHVSAMVGAAALWTFQSRLQLTACSAASHMILIKYFNLRLQRLICLFQLSPLLRVSFINTQTLTGSRHFVTWGGRCNYLGNVYDRMTERAT